MRITPAFALVAMVGCGSGSASDAPDAGAPPDDSSPVIDEPPEEPPSLITRCSAAVPPGAVEAPTLPTYAGTCPNLAMAPALTTIDSSGTGREFMVVTPSTMMPGEPLPVVFVWHWLGGSATDALERLELQQAVDLRRFIAIVPEAKGDILFRWPFGDSQSDGRLDEELQFFDDMLACVSAAFAVDKNCVSSMGVSAGALMTDQLASRRSERLASFISISGGVGGLSRDWLPAARKLPALVLWGGPDDMYPENIPLAHFDELSVELEQGLASDGHLLMECVHNCGHTLPPFDPPIAGAPSFDLIWGFAVDHPYWLPAGASVYQQTMPPAAPAWCGLGMNGAVPRPADATCPE